MSNGFIRAFNSFNSPNGNLSTIWQIAMQPFTVRPLEEIKYKMMSQQGDECTIRRIFHVLKNTESAYIAFGLLKA